MDARTQEKLPMKRTDWAWVLTCFGTAVGAGILFLPIQAGLSGILPLLILTVIVFPVTYVAHRGITRIVASCSKETDILGAVEMDLGRRISFIVSVLYFLSIISICISYATGLTNDVSSFMVNQLGLEQLYRPLLTFVLLFLMMLVILAGEKFMVKVTSIITFPLIILLVFIALYMIPHWNTDIFQRSIAWEALPKKIFLLFPLIVFAMNFSPVCSTLGASYRRDYPQGDEGVRRSDQVIKWTALILLVFVMFFVFSMVMTSTPAILDQAVKGNQDILTTLAATMEKPILKEIMPIIAILAILSSYFGHFTGTREGLMGIISHIQYWNAPEGTERKVNQKLKVYLTVLLTLGLWILAVYNPSILKIISVLSAPIIAMYAYLMPVILMRRVPRLFIYRSPWGAFVFIMGLIGIVGGIWNEFA